LFIDNEKGVQTSGKIYELITSNRPILILTNLNRCCLFEELVGMPGVFLVENEVNSIIEFFNNFNQLKLDSDRSLYCGSFSWDHRANQYKRVFEG
jgi:hypothetical protein